MPSMMSYEILPQPCRRDNYAYLVLQEGLAWVVDPTDFEPVHTALVERKCRLQGILATHHHHDHVGGIAELCAWSLRQEGHRPWVAGHASDRGRIPQQDRFIDAPRGHFIDSQLQVAGHTLWTAHIPGHTTGAIAYRFANEIFTGDTLFSGGCGRLFEGSAQDMFESFKTLLDGPEDCRLWFGHEYTQNNLRFALENEPDNPDYQSALDALSIPSCPSTIGRERKINIFARAATAQAFAELRSRKDKS